jgi:hypothetical protein
MGDISTPMGRISAIHRALPRMGDISVVAAWW